MLMIIFPLYFLFVAIIGVGVSVLLIRQDSEIRRLRRALEDQTAQAQNNTKQLEKFYQEKKQFMDEKNDEMSKFEARLQDERDIAALAVKNSEIIKTQLKQQQEEFAKLQAEAQRLFEQVQQANESKLTEVQNEKQKSRTEIQKLTEELQQANESRLIEVTNEKQKWADVLQSKDETLQKLGSEATSMESVLDTLGLISKEMDRRLQDHCSKIKLLEEKKQENLQLLAQLEN